MVAKVVFIYITPYTIPTHVLIITGYLVGDKLSYADVELFVGLLFVSKLTGDAVVPKFPALAKYYERISNLPAVKKYYSSDPYA